MQRVHALGCLGTPAAAELFIALQDLTGGELVQGADAQIQRALHARESQDHRPRRSQPAHPEAAPDDLAQRSRSEYPVWHVGPQWDPRVAVEAQLVEHGVLDDGQLVF